MTILNNGEHGQDGTACVDIYAEHVDETTAQIVAEMRIKGIVYSLSAEVKQ